MRLLFLLAVLLLGPAAAHAQSFSDPCYERDTTVWRPGPGWEAVGDCATQGPDRLFFDANGTLYAVDGEVDTLDTSGGGRGVWRRLIMTPHWLYFLDMIPLSTADSLVAWGGWRSADRGRTWHAPAELGPSGNLYAVPPGAYRAGRLFTSYINAPPWRSDDRGYSWGPVRDLPEGYDLQATSPAAFPAGPGPWGEGYGGRMITAGFDRAVSISDDGGDRWRRSSLWTNGRYFEAAVLARPPAEGGGLRAVVIGAAPSAPNGCAAVWTSDDGGDSWTVRAPICEPCSFGFICASPVALLPLARRQTGGAPVSGPALDWPETEWETTEAVAVMSLGGLFRTRDGGATWTREQIPIERGDPEASFDAATLSPDGRLYVSVHRFRRAGAWMLRTAEGLVVSRDEAAPSSSALAVSVRPNPSDGGRVAVTVTLVAPSTVRVVVVDAVGRTVAVLHDGASPAGPLALPLDTSRLAPGVYVVRALAGDAASTARLVVSR